MLHSKILPERAELSRSPWPEGTAHLAGLQCGEERLGRAGVWAVPCTAEQCQGRPECPATVLSPALPGQELPALGRCLGHCLHRAPSSAGHVLLDGDVGC